MALKKVKGNFERMFDKNLTDLVRGIRNNKDNEVKKSRTLKISVKNRFSMAFNPLLQSTFDVYNMLIALKK